MVRQPIEQGGGHFGVAEDFGPFREAEIGGDDDAGPLVECPPSGLMRQFCVVEEGRISSSS